MLVMKKSGGGIVAGGCEFDLDTGKLRAAGDVLTSMQQDVVLPVFGPQFHGKLPHMVSFPAGGQTHPGAWVVMFTMDLYRKYRTPSPPWNPWHRFLPHRPKESRKGDKPAIVHLAIVHSSRETNTVVAEVQIPIPDSPPTGVFRFFPAIPAPDGGLILPGMRITPGMEVVHDPEIGWDLQGLWPHRNTFLRVSRFGVENPSGKRKLLHPIGRDIGQVEGNDPLGGFLVWADPSADLALWAIYRAEETWRRGTLELVNTSTLERIWTLDQILPQTISFLPDGRWAAIREYWEPVPGEWRMDLIIGLRGRFVYRRIPKLHTFRLGLSAFPLSRRQWVLVTPSWLMILNDRVVKRFVEIPLNPIISFPDITVVDNGKVVAVLPNSWVSPDAVLDTAFEMEADSLLVQGDRAMIRSYHPQGFLMIPQKKLVSVGQLSASSLSWDFLANNGTYMVWEWSSTKTGWIRVLFIDPEGNLIREHRFDGFGWRDTVQAITVGKKFLVAASLTGEEFPSEKTLMEIRLMLFDQNGELLSQQSLQLPYGKICLAGHEDKEKTGVVLLKVDGYKRTRMHVMIGDNDMMAFQIVPAPDPGS